MSRKRYSEEYLRTLANVPVNEMDQRVYTTYRTTQAQGTNFYGLIPEEFPVHYRKFQILHDNAKQRGTRLSNALSRTVDGLINFILTTGPVNSQIVEPTMARQYPRKGIVRGNLRWFSRRRYFQMLSQRRKQTTR
jgi:hypothetical protein